MNFLKKFMAGRYGVDSLNRFLLGVFIVVSVLYMFTQYRIINIISLVLLVILYYRIFSRNINKRYEENQLFLQAFGPYKKKIDASMRKLKGRKDYKYFKCPNCEKELRVPKGKGMIKITCPNCKTKITRKS